MKKKIALVRGINSGFTFIELVIVLAILGLMLAVAVPNFQKFRPGYERRQLVATLSVLTQRAWQNALATHELHRLWFDLERRKVVVQKATDKKDRSGEQIFEEISDEYVPASYHWPESLQIKDFFADGADLLHVPGLRVEELWFYVFPDGSAQEVIVNFFDTADTSESEAGTRLSLVLNPFSVKFAQYETFQQP